MLPSARSNALLHRLAALLLAFSASTPALAATLTDSGGSVLVIDLGSNEDITASSDGSTYTLTSNQSFSDGGVASPGTDFSGFGSSTLSVLAPGLTRYQVLNFTDDGDGADLRFSGAGGGSWEENIVVELDGIGSRVGNTAGATPSTQPLQWQAELIDLREDISADGIQFSGPVFLRDAITLTSSFSIIFQSTVRGEQSLTLSSPVLVVFQDAVGQSIPLTELSVAAGGSTSVNGLVRTSGNQSYANPLSIPAGAATIQAADLDLQGTVSGSGSLTIEPFDPASDINLGTAAAGSGLHLSAAEVALLADGLAAITIGAAGGTGTLTVDGASFNDPLTLRAAQIRVDGSVAVDGDLSLQGELVGTANGLTPGTGHSQIRLLGSARTLDLSAASLYGEVEFPAAVGNQLTLIELADAGSAVLGSFAGAAEGAALRFGIYGWTISYAGGDGNDVVLQVAQTLDYADAPDSAPGTGSGNYRTLLADNGPRHGVGQPVYLGGLRDAEADGFNSSAADGDNLDGGAPADEDGLALSLLALDLTTGTTPAVVLNTNNRGATPATLYGWIDYNRDGDFDNASERAQLSIPAGTSDGLATLSFPSVPVGSTTGATYARFRISSDAAAANPFGAASDGEVEDHRARIFDPSDGFVRSRTRQAQAGAGTFGSALAAIGDVNGDGIDDLAVGRPSSSAASSVEIQLLDAQGAVSARTFIPSQQNGTRFGASVAPLGDLDGDGVADIAVGEPLAAGGQGGLVLILLNPDGSAKQRIQHASATAGNDQFGRAVANIGDLDGDGVVDLAVGLPLAGTSQGAISILFLDRTGDIRERRLIASGGVGGGPNLGPVQFATALAALGDLDGDGVTELAVGAPRAGPGALYILFMNRDGTVRTDVRHASGNPVLGTLAVDDNLGQAVAALGDINADGVADLALGIPGFDAFGRGKVLLLQLSSTGALLSGTALAHQQGGVGNLGSDRGFGSAISKLDDRNGNGVIELMVGAPGAGGGSTHLLRLNALPRITDPDPTPLQLDEDPAIPATVLLSAVDRDSGDSLTWSLASPASNGVASISGTGSSQTLSYDPLPDFSGSDSVQVMVSDGQSADTVTVAITVHPVNDAPTISAPASIGVIEDIASAVSPIGFADSDAGGAQVQATFSVPGGALTGTFGTGVVVGGSDTARTLRGTISQLNSYIANGNLRYTTAPNNTSDVSLQVLLEDLGNSGAGGSMSASQTVTLTVTAQNDPPSVTVPASFAVDEDLATALGGIGFADVDAGANPVLATFSVPRGLLTPTFGTGVVVGGSATARTLQGTIAQLNSYIANGHLSYTTAPDDTADVLLQVSIDDLGNSGAGGSLSDSQSLTLTVNAANDPPSLSLPSAQTVTEDVATALAGISFADIDAADNSVRATFSVPQGALNPTFGTGVVVGGTATARTLLGTIAQLNSYIANGDLSYTTALNSTDDVQLSVLIDDLGNVGSGGNQTASANMTLNVDAQNDPPTIAASAGLMVVEDLASALTGVVFADPDVADNPLQATFSVPRGSLSAVSGAGVSVGGDALSLTLDGSLADLNAFVAGGALSYTTAPDDVDDVLLNVSVDDLGNSGAGGAMSANTTLTLGVEAQNDPPSISAPPSIAVIEDTESTIAGIVFADPDAGNNAIEVVLAVARGELIASSGSGVVAVVTGLQLTLTGTLDDLNAFVATNQISYLTAPDDVADVLLSVSVDDLGNSGAGGSQTASQNLTLTVSAANDPPTITAPASIGVIEDTESTIAGIAFADPDAGNSAIEAVLAVARGELIANSGSGVVAVETGLELTLTGTLDDLNAFVAANQISYITAPDDVADVLLSVSVDDLGNSGAGGSQSSSQDLSLIVTPVNDAPSFAITPSVEVGIDAGAQSIAGFAFDIVAGPPDEAGQILSFAVTANSNPTLFAAAPVLSADGTLSFTAAPGLFGDATISVVLSDDGGTANGGGNASDEQSFMIRVGEQVAPTVTGAFSFPGGALAECAQLQQPVTALGVRFSEAMADPPGDTDPGDVTNPANYRLLAAGADQDLDSISCAGVLGDDQSLPIAAVNWDGSQFEAEIVLNQALADEPYRLLVCASLEDQAGNALGTDFALGFRQDAANRYANGAFDCSLDGWSTDATVAGEITHAVDDRHDAGISGSARVQQLGTSSEFGLSQCLNLEADGRYGLSGSVRVDQVAADAQLERFCVGSTAPDCTNLTTPVEFVTAPLAVSAGIWLPFAGEHSLRADEVSALCVVNVFVNSGGAVDLFLDGLRVEDLILYADGFENPSAPPGPAPVP